MPRNARSLVKGGVQGSGVPPTCPLAGILSEAEPLSAGTGEVFGKRGQDGISSRPACTAFFRGSRACGPSGGDRIRALACPFGGSRTLRAASGQRPFGNAALMLLIRRQRVLRLDV